VIADGVVGEVVSALRARYCRPARSDCTYSRLVALRGGMVMEAEVVEVEVESELPLDC